MWKPSTCVKIMELRIHARYRESWLKCCVEIFKLGILKTTPNHPSTPTQITTRPRISYAVRVCSRVIFFETFVAFAQPHFYFRRNFVGHVPLVILSNMPCITRCILAQTLLYAALTRKSIYCFPCTDNTFLVVSFLDFLPPSESV